MVSPWVRATDQQQKQNRQSQGSRIKYKRGSRTDHLMGNPITQGKESIAVVLPGRVGIAPGRIDAKGVTEATMRPCQERTG
jgi:hypothetical protein